jgi:hypothetical protein
MSNKLATIIVPTKKNSLFFKKNFFSIYYFLGGMTMAQIYKKCSTDDCDGIPQFPLMFPEKCIICWTTIQHCSLCGLYTCLRNHWNLPLAMHNDECLL